MLGYAFTFRNEYLKYFYLQLLSNTVAPDPSVPRDTPENAPGRKCPIMEHVYEGVQEESSSAII